MDTSRVAFLLFFGPTRNMATLGLEQDEDPLATQTTQTAWPVTNFTRVYLDQQLHELGYSQNVSFDIFKVMYLHNVRMAVEKDW